MMPQDYSGNILYLGDKVIYATRRGCSLYLVQGVVDKIYIGPGNRPKIRVKSQEFAKRFTPRCLSNMTSVFKLGGL